ncbi:MAG: MerR family transcriptional regulator [Thermoanaerobaculia bacterium]
MPRKRKDAAPRHVMISVVAERYGIHPQTLRLYEREGLLVPSRSAGNTRLYDEPAIQRLEAILTLTRDLGVNLAGVEIILKLREQLAEMQREAERLMSEVEQMMLDRRAAVDRRHALVRLGPRPLVKS